MQTNHWLENFNETCQDIMEDTFLLDALAMYATNDGYFTRSEREYFPEVFRRPRGYLSQRGNLDEALQGLYYHQLGNYRFAASNTDRANYILGSLNGKSAMFEDMDNMISQLPPLVKDLEHKS